MNKPDWENRNTESLSGWINELATLADHPQVREIWIRQAMGVIVRGLNRFATPAQPVALSTLTDEESFDRAERVFWLVFDSVAKKRKGLKSVLLGDMIALIEAALAASAPAQQAEPVRPEYSAEVKALKRMAEAGWTDPDISVASLQKALKEALALAESEGSRAIAYLRRARKAEAAPPQQPQPVAAEVAAFDAAVAAELPRVSHVQFDSHEICKHFAENVRKRMAGTGSDESKKGEA